MKATLRFIEKDLGWGRLRKTLRELEKGRSHVKIGVFGNAGTKRTEGVDNVMLALIHEFGVPTRGIPERSFVRGAFEKNKPEYIAILKKLTPGIYTGKRSAAQVLGIMGMKAAADMQAYVRAGTNLAPLAPSTMKRKLDKSYKGKREFEGPLQAPKPLIDTGRLLNSITWQVVLKGSAVPLVGGK